MAKIQDPFISRTSWPARTAPRQAAYLLEKAMKDFDPGVISEKLDEIHAVEHAGDEKKHEADQRPGPGLHHPPSSGRTSCSSARISTR